MSSPVLTTAVDLRVGQNFVCTLDNMGHPACWGQNRYGNIGNGQVARSVVPVTTATPPAGTQFVHIAAGARQACAATDAGDVYCWGDNRLFQVDPTVPTTFLTTPQHLATITAQQLSGGRDHTCAIDASGSVRCWGSNEFGQLGASAASMTQNTIPGPFTWISASTYSSCGIKSPGEVHCWGIVPGQTSHLAPAKVPLPGTMWKQVSVGDNHVVVATATSVSAWGTGCDAVGGGPDIGFGTSMVVPGLPTATNGLDISAAANGGTGTCALVDNGTRPVPFYCWGEDLAGELSPTIACVPPTPRGGPEFDAPDPTHPGEKVSLSGGHGCGISTNSTLSCWGDNDELQLGIRPESSMASDVLETFGQEFWLQIALSTTFGCGISSADHSVKCWGTSAHGELGTGARFVDIPMQVLFHQ